MFPSSRSIFFDVGAESPIRELLYRLVEAPGMRFAMQRDKRLSSRWPWAGRDNFVDLERSLDDACRIQSRSYLTDPWRNQYPDAIDYLRLAESIGEKGSFSRSPEGQPDILRTPGYPGLLAICRGYRHPLVVYALQAVMLAATIGMIVRWATGIGLTPPSWLRPCSVWTTVCKSWRCKR